MSVSGYFNNISRELKLKKGDIAAEDNGPVLSGEISVERALKKDAEDVRGQGVSYRKVADYDAVLRSHCRLDEGDG